MGKPRKRYAGRGVPGGWRIWDNKNNRWWGELYEKQPEELLAELNGLKRAKDVMKKTRKYQKEKR